MLALPAEYLKAAKAYADGKRDVPHHDIVNGVLRARGSFSNQLWALAILP